MQQRCSFTCKENQTEDPEALTNKKDVTSKKINKEDDCISDKVDEGLSSDKVEFNVFDK